MADTHAPEPNPGNSGITLDGTVPPALSFTDPVGRGPQSPSAHRSRISDNASIRGLELPEGSRIEVEQVPGPDPEPWHPGKQRHGRTLALKVRIVGPEPQEGEEREIREAQTPILEASAYVDEGTTRPVLLPEFQVGGIFPWGQHEIAAQPRLQPLPGIYIDEILSNDDSGRIRHISVVAGSGMNSSAMVIVDPPTHPHDEDRATILVRERRWGLRRRNSPERAEAALGRVSHAGKTKGIPLTLKRGPTGHRENVRKDLNRIWQEVRGTPRPEGELADSITKEDIEVLRERASLDLPVFSDRSIRHIRNQEIMLPAATLRLNVRDAVGTAVAQIARTVAQGSFVTPADPASFQEETPEEEKVSMALERAAAEIALRLSTPLVAQNIENAVADWVNRSENVLISLDGGARLPQEEIQVEVQTPEGTETQTRLIERILNPAARQRQTDRLRTTARLPGFQNRRLGDAERDPPPGHEMFLAPGASGPAKMDSASQTYTVAEGASIVFEEDGTALPAIHLLEPGASEYGPVAVRSLTGRSIQLGIEPDAPVFVDGVPLSQEAKELDDPAQRIIAPPGAFLDQASLNPFRHFNDPVREAMNIQQQSRIVRMGDAEHPWDPLRAASQDPQEIDRDTLLAPEPAAKPFSAALRTAFASGGREIHEDACVLSASAAASLRIDLPGTTVLTRSPSEQPGLERVGPGSPQLQAEGISPADLARLCGISEEQASRIGPDGVIRTQEAIQAGDPIQITRIPSPEADPPWRWEVEASKTGGVVTAVSDDLGQREPDGRSRHVRVQVMDRRPLEVGDKIFLRGGSKYEVSQILPDDEMPGNALGPAQMVVNNSSNARRMNYSAYLEMDLGGRRDAAVEIIREDILKLDGLLADLPGDSPISASPEAQALLQEIAQGPLASLAFQVRGQDEEGAFQVEMSGEALAAGVQDWTKADFEERLRDTLIIEEQDPDPLSRGRLMVPGILRREDVGAIRQRLGEKVAQRAVEIQGDGPPIATIGVSGGNLNNQGAHSFLGSFVPHPFTRTPQPDQVGNTPVTFGVSAQDALAQSPAIKQELFSQSDEASWRRMTQAVSSGASPEVSPNLDREAVRHLQRLCRSAGIQWDPQEESLLPVSSESLRDASKGEIVTAAQGGLPGSLEDPAIFGEARTSRSRDRFGHIELPYPILHPWVQANPNPLANLLRTKDGAKGLFEEIRKPQGLETMQKRLSELREQATLDPVGLVAQTENSGATPEQVQAIRDLVESPQWNPQNLIMTAIPVPPLHMRTEHQDVGSTKRIQSPLDASIRDILMTLARVQSDTRGPEVQRATLASSVRRHFENLASMTGGKRGALARTVQGCRTPGMRALMLPAEDHVPLGCIEISVADAVQAHRPQVRSALERLGLSQQEAEKEMQAFPASERLLRIAQIAASEGVALTLRNPVMHSSSITAFEVLVRKDHIDRSVRVHPGILKGIAGDHDGDTMNVAFLRTPQALREARATRTVAHLIAKPGDGRPQITLQHDARLGALLEMRDLSAKGEDPRAWLRACIHPDLAERLEGALAKDSHWSSSKTTEAKLLDVFEARLAEMRSGSLADAKVVHTIDRLWDRGFARTKGAKDHVVDAQGLEELSQIAHKERDRLRAKAKKDGVPSPFDLCSQPLSPHADREARTQWAKDCATRSEAELGVIQNLVQKARKGGSTKSQKADLILQAAADGCQLKPSALTRLVLARGETMNGEGRILPFYIGTGIVQGLDDQALAASPIRNIAAHVAQQNGPPAAGSPDYVGQKIVETNNHLAQITQDDCGIHSQEGMEVSLKDLVASPRSMIGQRDPETEWLPTMELNSWSNRRKSNSASLPHVELAFPWSKGTWINAGEKPIHVVDPETADRVRKSPGTEHGIVEVQPGERIPPKLLKGLLSHPEVDPEDRIRLRAAPSPIQASPILLGAILTEPAGGLDAGQSLDRETLEKLIQEKAKVNIRSPLTCAAPEGTCAACAGPSLNSNGRLPLPGDDLSSDTGRDISEPISQAKISGKHTSGGTRGQGETAPEVFLHEIEALVKDANQQSAQAEEHLEKLKEKNRRRTEKTALHEAPLFDWNAPFTREDLLEDLMFESCLRKEENPLAPWAAAAALLDHVAGCNGTDPRHFRLTAAALAKEAAEGDLLADIHSAALSADPGHAAGRTKRHTRAISQVVAKIGARLNPSDPTPHPQSQALREREGLPLAARLAMDNDMEALRALDPQQLLERDHAGRTALMWASSQEAATILVKGGCSPWEEQGPQNIAPIEMAIVRTLPAGTSQVDREILRNLVVSSMEETANLMGLDPVDLPIHRERMEFLAKAGQGAAPKAVSERDRPHEGEREAA